MLHYMIQTIAFQVFFLLVYDAFLKKETFFNWNRLYLLSTAVLSIALPFIKINSFKDVVPQKYIINLPEIFIGNQPPFNANQIHIETISTQTQSAFLWDALFYVGVLIATLLLIFKITKIVWLLYKNPKSKIGFLNIVSLINSSAAFSFFNYIFLGERLSETEKESILKHEIVHVKQKHTLDLLFFEVLRIVFWFNPLVYMYQNKIMVLHEFIADDSAVKHQNKSEYYQNLLSQVFETKNISFINPFFKQSLIKKRIVMLQKSKSKQINLLKYVLLIPMIFGMLVYTSCVQNLYSQEKKIQSDIKMAQDNKLIQKIKAVKNQIQIQGNTSEEEDKGLNLLLKIVKQNDLDTQLVEEVQAYTSVEPKTDLMLKIVDVFEQIQAQGTISEEENKTLKELLILTSDDGFNNPFFADVIKDIEVPFAVIDQVPVFPGCESLTSNIEQKECMSKEISMFVSKNFNTNIGKEYGLVGKQRINVIFKINQEGNIVDVRSRAPHPALEAEAIRVIKMLPKMLPGKQRGKVVTVPYSLPIIFMVPENKSLEKND
ncbi:MAG: blaR1 peptidase M56 family protein [Flavobacteriaceae bacterium CG_4_10_14_3_um_filter_33_47]|nr:MAG: blaR1 peptidase M56 family protein [Flavobacteriaceae bacterium CG17_big_fil_post_rev_8_21_14_2_50_33_15]PIY12289.1 MAG: blaR1 peptidase M56 family protein [Flavobacteriaceae bacterium CG_4_10_14_3_um_filter_33_47]